MDGKNQYKSYKLGKQLPGCAIRTIKMSQFITVSETTRSITLYIENQFYTIPTYQLHKIWMQASPVLKP
jgi:hypothetical protein